MAAVSGSIGERRFVTMRFKRIKTWSHVYHVRRHNTREMECRHLEKGAPPPRLIVGTEDVGGSIRQALARYGVKHKPGEVLALEFVVSTSREVFDAVEGAERKRRVIDFLVCTLRAFCDRFKIEGQIVSVALHEDERTPHLHIVVVPLICAPDNRRKDKTATYRLSAKRVVGGRGDMSREQTRFASFFKEMGLERGKERSSSRHVSNREHEAMLEDARQAALAEREGLATDRTGIARTTLDLKAQRDALAELKARLECERAASAAERLRLREEAARLAAERTAVMEQAQKAEALKKRAIARMNTLRELVAAGEQLRDSVLALPEERRSPRVQKAFAATDRFMSVTEAATQDDAWLSTMLNHRSRGAAGFGR